MYEKYFGLSRSPFLMTPDPSALFLTPGHREALAGLSYAIMRRKGFVALVGQAGTGKTTLLNRFLEMPLGTDARTCIVVNPTLTTSEFLELLVIKFGFPYPPPGKVQRLCLLEKLLTETDKAGKACVLIIDEAHKLGFDVLEEIRLLSNFETSERKLLQIVLAGQPELSTLLRLPELWQLQQRIAVRLRLDPLSSEQIHDYLAQRWMRAGGQAHPFTKEAISLIAAWSRGVPRLINSICDNALLLALSGGARTVGSAEILEVVRDLDLLPVTAPSESAATDAVPGVDLPAPMAVPSSQSTTQLRTLGGYMPDRPKSFFRWRRGAAAGA